MDTKAWYSYNILIGQVILEHSLSWKYPNVKASIYKLIKLFHIYKESLALSKATVSGHFDLPVISCLYTLYHVLLPVSVTLKTFFSFYPHICEVTAEYICHQWLFPVSVPTPLFSLKGQTDIWPFKTCIS